MKECYLIAELVPLPERSVVVEAEIVERHDDLDRQFSVCEIWARKTQISPEAARDRDKCRRFPPSVFGDQERRLAFEVELQVHEPAEILDRDSLDLHPVNST